MRAMQRCSASSCGRCAGHRWRQIERAGDDHQSERDDEQQMRRFHVLGETRADRTAEQSAGDERYDVVQIDVALERVNGQSYRRRQQNAELRGRADSMNRQFGKVQQRRHEYDAAAESEKAGKNADEESQEAARRDTTCP